MFFVLLILLADAAVAQETRITRLGGRSTRLLGVISTEDDARRMLRDTRNQKNIESVLQQAGWSGSMADLDRAAQTGEFGMETIQPGTRLPFISFLRRGQPVIIRNAVWAGARPFDAYTLEVDTNGKIYKIFLPKPCGNLWFEEREKPAPPPPPPPPQPEAPPPPAPEVTPPPPPPPEVEMEVERSLFFVGAFLGKERRALFTAGDLTIADCVTLLGVKGGVLPRISDRAEVELAIGGKFVIGDDDSEDLDFDDDVEFDDLDHSIFADVAIHGLFDKGFVGAGVSFWDLTDDEFRTISLLLQLGFGGERVQFSVEGRAPFEDLDDLSNNYMFWAGIRFRP